MERRLLEPGYRFRPARPSRFWQWALTPLRRRVYRRRYLVRDVQLRGEKHVRWALAQGGGAMITINHPAHGDPFIIFEAMHRLGVPCCYLAAWQVFKGWFGLKGWAFQRLGAFSIDREGTDLRAFRTAVDVLAQGNRSLVIFPEGEVYHLNDRVTPLREGAAMIALAAARRRSRSGGSALHILPCALKYFYLDDPTPQLQSVMTRLEQRLYWRPQVDRPLLERIYRYAEAILGLKELEYLNEFGKGSLPKRISRLTEHILSQIEQRRLGRVGDQTIPARVKQLRRHILRECGADEPQGDDAAAVGENPAGAELSLEAITAAKRDLEDLNLVTQLFSYPGDYVTQQPSIERMTETLDKFEEDALGAHEAGARAVRRAVVSFAPTIDVTAHLADAKGSARGAAGTLTALIEQRIQEQLDQIGQPQPTT
ncbi:MAG: lysophospholipid acyltransferase family protein [Planctomycetota bacterium]|nr:lysophospholipid acyltransferase family protein [Planctomycetota bacterium]MCZ6543203.1 lysophospholipid acyltransferase family protein [Planctomycetota bacterium]MCZ6810363.1 lysophospholipid acyltransferase family protein [Planctomycetota bacterium]